MDYTTLQDTLTSHAAIRRRQRLQPAGGQGDKIFPPTYPGDRGPVHVFERRRVGDEEQICVLIDSVQSQANRMEEALLAAAEAERIRLPRLVVDFAAAGLDAVGRISVLDAPHRIFDAILRDSQLDGVPFRNSELGKRLKLATPEDASAIFEAAPSALVFGAWNSTGEGGGLGAKFARAITSEIIGVNVPADELVNRNTGEITLRTAGRRTGSRIDPLGIPRSIEVFKTADGEWALDKDELEGKAKKVRPSEINHGNITPSIDPLGVTCGYALQTTVLTLAGLRRLRFGSDERKNLAARSYLAALALVAATESNRQGMALRSRCDLVCDGLAPLEIVSFDGSVREITLDPDEAAALCEAAFDEAVSAGFDLNPEPVILEPQDKLVKLVRLAQEKALSDEGGEDA